ncbi:MAG: serine/threonine-protein kinase [Polyangiaceae bacterium]
MTAPVPPENEPPEADDLAPGARLGPYTIDTAIGSGGMATVFLAHHDGSPEPVALKALLPRYAAVPLFVERFEREARAASSLSHRNVIRILDVCIDAARPYLVMEYLRGETLTDRLLRVGRMSTAAIASVLIPIVSAVSAAHAAGILHRDLKPDNILLARSPEGERPVLLDFGISKQIEGPRGRALTQAGQVVGTPYYMSPEQIRSEDLDARADQYALGVMMYELSTGIRPFRAEQSVFVLMAEILLGQPQPPSQIELSIPSAFEAVLLRAMAARRDDRYPTMDAFARALLPFAPADLCRLWAPTFGVDPDEIEPHAASSPSVAERVAFPPAPPSNPEGWLDTQLVEQGPPSRSGQLLRPEDLRALPGLGDVSEAELRAFCTVATGRELPSGALLFAQGTIGDTCFAIVRGSLQVSKEIAGSSMVLDVLGTGAFVGQDALVDKAARSVTARAVEDTLVIEMNRDGMQRLLGLHDQVALRLLEQVALGGIRQLRAGTRKLARLLEARTVGRNPDGTEITASRPLEQLRAAVREWSVRIDEG